MRPGSPKLARSQSELPGRVNRALPLTLTKKSSSLVRCHCIRQRDGRHGSRHPFDITSPSGSGQALNALLVRTAAAGLDVSAIVGGLNQPLPLVRFQLLVGKATELCQEVKSLGANMLAAIDAAGRDQPGASVCIAVRRQLYERPLVGNYVGQVTMRFDSRLALVTRMRSWLDAGKSGEAPT